MADRRRLSEPLRVLVVDDEPLARRRLLELLADRSDLRVARTVALKVVGEASNGREAVEAITQEAPDLVLLDIQMPDLDGFDVIEAVGPERMPAVIFVTAYDEYALGAFEVAAVDYLLKPFEDERFELALGRAVEALRQRSAEDLWERLACLVDGRRPEVQGRSRVERSSDGRALRRLAVERGGRTYLVPVAEIEWIEAAGPYVRLHTTRTSGSAGPHLVRDSLKRLERALDARRFVRVHRSTMVQADQVDELRPLFHGEYELVLRSGAIVKLSRTYRDRLDRLLT